MCVSKDSWDIKLIDFGLAMELVPGTKLKGMKGTPEFMGMLDVRLSGRRIHFVGQLLK